MLTASVLAQTVEAQQDESSSDSGDAQSAQQLWRKGVGGVSTER